ncbi:hypothetical protein [Castellaniella defragrans]|uniref:hypothetical protein n=1 Tax=Castellaniella defragrans TaxID=75697 RepID=UPI0023F58B16|nr:hypothetical protein [Castellaniella defragrans]
MAVDLFNEQWYLDQNPDVAAAVAAGLTTAYQHFMAYGQYESRAPSTLFDPAFYLGQNPDVAAAVAAGLASAYEHFLLYGQSEPRTISPFIDLAAYANANPDLAAVEGLNLYQHLVTYGLHENRDLGNGITLSQFANDPVFNAALADPDHILEALARIAEVAPFLPDFQPPEGWTPPADTPIPTDFVPPEGLLLVVPPSVSVPEGTELPDTFKPVDSGSGGTGGTGGSGGGGGGGSAATFTVTETAGVLTFGGTATGKITLSVNDANQVALIRGSVVASNTETDAGAISFGSVEHISLDGNTQLVINGAKMAYPQVELDGGATGGSPRFWADYDAASTSASIQLHGVVDKAAIGVTGSHIETLTLAGSFTGATDESGWHQLQVWDGVPSGTTALPALQTLILNMDSNTDLAAYPPLGVLTQPTTLNASGSTGGLKITPAEAPTLNWAIIKTGSGDDVLHFSAQQLKNAVSLSTGSGTDALTLSGPDATARTIALDSDGTLTADISALKATGNQTKIAIEDIGTQTTIKLANINAQGNKGDLSSVKGQAKSNQHIELKGEAANYHGVTLALENMTISSTWGYTHAPVANDTLDLSGLGAIGVSNITQLVLSKGETTTGGLDFVNFKLTFDLDGDPITTTSDTFTLELKNLVSQNVYNNMLKALDVVQKDNDATTTLPIDLLKDDFNLSTAWTNLGLDTAAGSYNTHNWSTIEDSTNPVVTDIDLVIGLIGILVSEGTISGITLPSAGPA